MRVTVLQVDDRLAEDTANVAPSPDAAVRVRFTAENRRRALSRGWEYDFRPGGPADHPPWWWKVFLIRDMLVQEPWDDDRLVLWMDTDALLTECGILSPASLAEADPQACMWVSPDAPPARSPFNAGCFLVRGSAKGREVMHAWCALYDPRAWKRTPNITTGMRNTAGTRSGLDKQPASASTHWTFLTGSWAGEAFEQGAFVRHILPKATAFAVRVLPYYVFNEIHCNRPHTESIAVHLYGRLVHQACHLKTQRCVSRWLHWQPYIWHSVDWAQEWWWLLLVSGLLLLVMWRQS